MPLTLEHYLDALLELPGLWRGQVSPDGKWVAWTWFHAAPTAEVYAAPTDASAPPMRLTDTPEDTILVSWTPDSRAVLVSQDTAGNERDQLFRVTLDAPGVMQPLTEANPPYFLRGGQLHPNGAWLVYGANYDAAADKEIEPTWIYRHDLHSGERRALAKPERGGWIFPDLSPDGAWVLYTRTDLHPAGRQIWLVDINGAQDREILNFGAEVKTFASWFPDSARVLVQTETPTHRRIGVWTLGAAPNAVRWLLEDPARNIEQAVVPEHSESIVLVETRDARQRCSLLHPDTGQETTLAAVPGTLRLLAPYDETGGEWIALHYSSRQPHDIVRVNLHKLQPEQFVSLSRVWEHTALTPQDFAAAEDFRWQSVDGLAIQGWLYRAAGTARGTVVYVHGGPTWHSADAINNQIQYLVRAGFNVLDPNYRGSTGFSMAFREAIKVDGWGGREQDDIRSGIEALLAAGIAQPGKVGITGTSYGGYSSWCAITRFPPEVLAASAPICGMTDLVVDYQTTRPDLRPYSAEMLGGTPDEVPEKYRERSPLYFVDQIKGRLMIVQGMQDPNVTPENVRAVTRALQDAGVEYELLAFDDEGHGIGRPHNQRRL